MDLPTGCFRIPLKLHEDDRGSLVELFRQEWKVGETPLQWNLVKSKPNTLRGFHIHLRNYDYLHVSEGVMILGLMDLRVTSPSYESKILIEVNASEPEAIVVPPGVGHGFYFPCASIHLYGLSEYWHPDHHLGCYWDDPDLGLNWPISNPRLSAQDRDAPSLAELRPIIDAQIFDQQVTEDA